MKHVCVMCGKKLTADTWIVSRLTGDRFCADIGSCRARLARKPKKAAA